MGGAVKLQQTLQITPGLSTLWPPRETEVWYGQRFSGEVVNFVELLQVKLGQTRFYNSENIFLGYSLKLMNLALIWYGKIPENDNFLGDFSTSKWQISEKIRLFWPWVVLIFLESLKWQIFWKFDLFWLGLILNVFWMPQNDKFLRKLDFLTQIGFRFFEMPKKWQISGEKFDFLT